MPSQGKGLDNLIQEVLFISYFYGFVIKSALGILTESKSDFVVCLATRVHITVCRTRNSAYKENVQTAILSGQFLLSFQVNSPKDLLLSCWSQNVYTSSKGGKCVCSQYNYFKTLFCDFIDLAGNSGANRHNWKHSTLHLP